MKIVYVFADTPEDWNSSEWRCAVPVRAINRTGRHSAELLSINDFGFNTPQAQTICNPADIIVVQRNLFGPTLSAIQHWKARDKVIIADFDDAYNLMPASNASYPFWIQGLIIQPDCKPQKINPPPLTQFKWGLRLVHSASVPSKRLADDWRNYAEVHHIPNYIDLEKYQNVIQEEHEGVIIGWGGSASHLQSFTDSGVLIALQQVCKKRQQVKVMLCGNDHRIFDKLELPPDQKIIQPWVAYHEWVQVLSKFDIGLAPLHGAYDERRSWIKILEYMVMKTPWIASQGPAYQELNDYGWLVKNTSESWERVLLNLVDHIDDYKVEASQDAYFFGISQSIDENIDRILNFYENITQRVS